MELYTSRMESARGFGEIWVAALPVFVRTCEPTGEALASEPRNDGRERSGPNKHRRHGFWGLDKKA